jgi:hypothetical protein
MQGYVELSDVRWSNNVLSGNADMVENEPMKIIIAPNGKKLMNAKASGGSARAGMLPNGLIELTLLSSKKEKLPWAVVFSN